MNMMITQQLIMDNPTQSNVELQVARRLKH